MGYSNGSSGSVRGRAGATGVGSAGTSLGPQVGEQVPGFSLPDQNGQIRTLESILGPNGAMLLFYRSADW